MKRSLKWVVAAAAVSVPGAGFVGGRAWAGGIPAAGALNYSGLLQDASGAALTGSHPIQVNFWPTATPATTPLCQTPSQSLPLIAGRFSVALPAPCVIAVRGTPDLWAQVLVDGNPLPPSKLGAVPYAIEANHAVNADNAAAATAAGGALATQLSSIQSQVHAASAFRATLSSATMVPPSVYTQVAFDHVIFDSGTEYNKATGAFTPKSAGVYLIVCACEYGATVAGSLYQSAVFINGTRVGITEGSVSATNGMTPEHTMVTQLAANDVVTCSTTQLSGAATPLYVGLTQFEAARLY